MSCTDLLNCHSLATLGVRLSLFQPGVSRDVLDLSAVSALPVVCLQDFDKDLDRLCERI